MDGGGGSSGFTPAGLSAAEEDAKASLQEEVDSDGRGMTPEERRTVEERTKKSIKEVDSGRKRNVFISFASVDLDEVNLLRGQAKNESSNIVFNDWSLRKPFNSERAEYIKRGIRERIRQSSVTVVYLSDNTADSDWVDWEIRVSLKMGKGVVAMHKGDTAPKRLPKAITENKIRVVPWNQQQLNEAIQEQAENR